MTRGGFDFCKERRRIIWQMRERGWSLEQFDISTSLKKDPREEEWKILVPSDVTRKLLSENTLVQEDSEDVLQRKRLQMYRQMGFCKEKKYLLHTAARKKVNGSRKKPKPAIEKKPVAKIFNPINFNLNNPRSQ